MNLLALPALDDNYIWLLHDGHSALAVDPASAEPAIAALQQHGLQLAGICITHHHADHTGGINALFAACGTPETQVYLPATDGIAPASHAAVPAAQTRHCSGGEQIKALGLRFDVIDVPGHTAGHIAWYAAPANAAPVLFCGDTLFSGGCGRLFEGTPAQMLDSLIRLAALPDATRVCCAHEYTLANLRFALAVEPDNAALHAYMRHCEALRAQGLPTLPSTLAQERAINPFLRTAHPAVQQAAQQRNPAAHGPVQGFAALREWKNHF